MIKFTTPVIRTMLLAAAVSSFAIPAFAQDAAPADDSSMTSTTTTSSTTTAKPMMMKKHDGMMNVETRIKTLHDKLMITSAQESDWATVAQTMRDNESTIHELIEARHANPDSMTAIDDLQSYQKITQAHADGLAKMTAAFQTVYNDMTDAQKKNADEVFGKFEGHRGAKKPMKHNQ